MEGTYDIFGNLDPYTIYLARPGQRIINGLQGIEEDTCHLTKNFNNTSVLEFTIDRDLDGEINPIYELVQQHYELYIPYNGWFKINEEPLIDNDGNIETKQVRAESLEIELQQYDIMDFEINTASESSREMMAVDNIYEYNDYYMFHDNVQFYRDTTKLQELSDIFQGYTLSAFESYLYDYPDILRSWRVTIEKEALESAMHDAVDEYNENGKTAKASALESLIGEIDPETMTKKELMNFVKLYPEVLKYVHVNVEQAYDPEDPSSPWYSFKEIIDLEIQREDELSLMTILLKEHGWKVGYIDKSTRVVGSESYTLAEETGQFNIDAQDIYSFITQDLANYYQCIFLFDTETYTVNIYRIESLNLDTNIYLSFHNIQNSISRSSDKPIYTVFNVKGGDNLYITEANFGESWIEDISYFLNTDHFSQEFIDKYNYWKQYRDDPELGQDNKSWRTIYMNLSVQRRLAEEKADELYSRVPVAISNTYQYSTMSDKELIEEYNRYEAILKGYEDLYVDENGDFIGLEELAAQYPREYSDYIMIRDQILGTEENPGNILIAIKNRQVELATDTREYLDGWEYDFATYGKSYGVDELKNKIVSLKNNLDTLAKRGHNHRPAEEGDTYAWKEWNQYQKYATSLEQAEIALNERQAEYDAAYSDMIAKNREMLNIKKDCDIKNQRFDFTEDELWLLDKYRIHTDYTNENIFFTTTDNAKDRVLKAYELMLDAQEILSAEAQPQWTFQTTQDNFLLMPEFKNWHGQLELGSFIRVEFREGYQVKLRVVSIGFNPFLTEPTIDLEFSNMVQYAAKRNDFMSLLQNGRGSSKNQISYSLSSTSGSSADINIDSTFLLKLVNSGVFSSYMSAYASDITGEIGANIGSIINGDLANATIHVSNIIGEDAEFDELFAKYIDAKYIVTEVLRADSADINSLTAEIIRVGTDSITEITGDYISTAQIKASQIIAGDGSFESLAANIINTNAMSAHKIDVDNITGDLANFAKLVAGQIKATDISTETFEAKLADIDLLKANSALIGSEFVKSLTSVTSTSITSIVNEEYVSDIVANNVTVNDLKAEDLVLSDTMSIVSKNGALVMNGTALQIWGKKENGDDYVGIQLGYDTTSTPSLILCNEQGDLVLTPQGITEHAIARELIVNDMIKEHTITENRLGFDVMKKGDTVTISQIYDGHGDKWGVQYTNFIENTNNKLTELSNNLEDMANYTVRIEAPNGLNVYGGSIELIAYVYRNGVDVTEQFTSECFVWTRHSQNASDDEAWNALHTNGSRRLTVTGADVDVSTTFECCFSYDYSIVIDLAPSLTVTAGTVVNLEVAAVGTTSYRWQYSNNGSSWNDFSNNTSTYSFVATKDMDGRMYRCYLSNGYITLSSKIMTLHVEEQEQG